jgi:hypothetical protein
MMRRCFHPAVIAYAVVTGLTCYAQSPFAAQPRIIELTVDKDSRYRQGNKVAPTIEVLAGESLVLRITAVRAWQVARDGSVHGLALLDKNCDAVPGWRFFLHAGAGVQELAVTAPAQAGRYAAVCTVICSDAHEGIGFTLLVTAPRANVKE